MIPDFCAQYLTQLDYNLVDPYDTNLKKKFYNNLWVKNIVVSGINIRLGVFFRNWDFITPPQVYLFEDDLIEINKIIKHFRFPLPHFSIESQFTYLNKKAYSFCYVLHDKLEINRKYFSKIIIFMEMQFKKVILDLINPSNFLKEIRNEIVPMWMMLSNEFQKKYSLENLFVEFDDNLDFQTAKLTYISTKENNCQKTIDSDFIVLNISHFNIPSVSNYFNVEGEITLGKMLLFINDIHLNCFNILKRNLNKIKSDQNIFISLVFENHVLSFYISWKKKYYKLLSGNVRIASEILRDQVLPVYIKKYCMQELVDRNLKDIKTRNLTDLKILQIGVGAIGGYVADALIKIGAGLGEGQLTVCDNDDIKVENVGRHVLGKKYIGRNKANAIVDYIKEQVGSKNIQINYVNQSVNIISNLDVYDLIIDATGQIEIAEYLNEKVIQIPDQYRPNLLHLWIYGNGECVQALINNPFFYESNGGCISCLHQSGVDDYKEDLDPLGNKNFRKIMGLGPCAAYTPYSISSSLAVAGLAIDILLEWRNVPQMENNYFTRYSVGYAGPKISDMTLTASTTCPNCSERFTELGRPYTQVAT
ncbi:ThiF family adenylyltransferase [Acinetobacter sp. WCHAc060042]|uniref:ThiF family adenylyltransferase n=1 Tax=Acinetobacter sp. WCHAc060042 TaxID=2213016 RepID=UPI000DA69144|nr:ThiF family adenylyltransferase [Acinetobacter sp. WCHAc060042]